MNENAQIPLHDKVNYDDHLRQHFSYKTNENRKCDRKGKLFFQKRELFLQRLKVIVEFAIFMRIDKFWKSVFV